MTETKCALRQWILLLILSLSCLSSFARDTRPSSGECEWLDPGARPYMLDLGLAVDRFKDIPTSSREVLKEQILSKRKFDVASDHIAITNNGVVGLKGSYELRDMNGGNGEICFGKVTTKKWKPGQTERGLVFCDAGYCIAYKSVCRNVSRAFQLTEQKTGGVFFEEVVSGGFTSAQPLEDSKSRALGLMFALEETDRLVPVESREIASGAVDNFPETDTGYRPVFYSGGFSGFTASTYELIPSPTVTSDPRRMRVNPDLPLGSVLPVAVVPEPGTLLMMAIGLICLRRMTRVSKKSFMPFFYPKPETK